MPQNKYALARYYLINSLLIKYEYVKSAQIVESCREQLGCRITQRCIQMDIYAMKNDTFLGYYAPIDYCKKRKAYYYTDDNYAINLIYFSKQEITAIENVLILLKQQLRNHEYEILHNIYDKIKIFIC